jgi:hypothetical protein
VGREGLRDRRTSLGAGSKRDDAQPVPLYCFRMLGKLVMGAAAFAAGYLVGSRQGRAGYERIKDRAAQVWQNPSVQHSVSAAHEFATESLPVVGGSVASAIDRASKKVDDAAQSRRSPTDETPVSRDSRAQPPAE